MYIYIQKCIYCIQLKFKGNCHNYLELNLTTIIFRKGILIIIFELNCQQTLLVKKEHLSDF